MLKRDHVLTQYHEITEQELLPAARHHLKRLEADMQALIDDAHEAIPSSIIPYLGPESAAHGEGMTSDPVIKGYKALEAELVRIETVRNELVGDIQECRASIRMMEDIIRSVASWMRQADAEKTLLGELPYREALRRFRRDYSYEDIGKAAGVGEKKVRRWFEKIDFDIRQLIHPRVTLRHEKRRLCYVPVLHRKHAVSDEQYVLLS